jgi:GNAT superfamily N-acetyltransferase
VSASPSAADPSLLVVTAEERPDLWEAARPLFQEVWPEYNLHGNHTGRIFSSLVPRHAGHQVLVYHRELDRVIARGRSIPFRWDGSLADLPTGIDALGQRALDEEEGRPTALSALAAEVDREYQGRGLSRLVLRALRDGARAAGLESLVAPVRPSLKDRYPLTPIDRYAQWQRGDGLPFDPWMRVHVGLGATALRPEPRSLQIEAPVSDWQAWTGMEFPEDGAYVFPLGLAPLYVRSGTGSYWEPNVWMLHGL